MKTVRNTARQGQIGRILVIDDDSGFRMLARRVLQNSGWEVLEAADGSRGLEIYEETRPDLVLLDLMLPGLGGLEVCRRLHRSWGDETAPVVMASASDDPADIERGYEAGVTDFVGKPANWELVRHRLQSIRAANDNLRKLRESQRSLALAQHIARLGSWTWRVDDGHMEWSEETFHVLGLTPGRDRACKEAFRSRIHPDDRERISNILREAIRLRKGYRCEHRIIWPEGEIRYVRHQSEVVSSSSRGDREDHVVVHGTLQDVTEHARARSSALPRQLRFPHRVVEQPALPPAPA